MRFRDRSRPARYWEEWQIILATAVIALVVIVGTSVACYNIFG